MKQWNDFHGPNAGYVLELYERYQQDPNAVDPETRAFFADWVPPADAPSAAPETAASASISTNAVVGAVNLAQAIRNFGHLAAQLDPLGSPPPGDPELDFKWHQVTEEDLRQLPASLVGGPIAQQAANALEAVKKLQETYCSRIGFDYSHIGDPEEREWLRNAAESGRYRVSLTNEYAHNLLKRLTQVEAFELFLQRSFPTKYRFSIEGLDVMVPMLDEIINASMETGMSNVMLAMAHRGRLNILAHIMNKPYELILAEFKDPLKIQELQNAIGWTIGDVKYHEGVERMVDSQNPAKLRVTMPPNPSHLEIINPVSIGMARAAGTRVDSRGAPEFDADLTMQILIHGDAAFPGQGVIAETFNLSQLPGYWVGGTLHIIANNQLGFTTLPEHSRSTRYASDLAKGFKVPIVHVNADDPEACMEVARIAFAYQDKFEKDFLIDLIGYRRYGHNELDEPGFTQPKLYETVREHPTVRQIWSKALIDRKVTTEEETAKLFDDFTHELQGINEALENMDDRAPEIVKSMPVATVPEPPKGLARRVATQVSADRLLAINESLKQFPADFSFYSSRLENTIKARRETLTNEKNLIDWATAEELAFASILEDGIAIRLTGQDSERGTFSHRHAVLHDSQTGNTFTPLHALSQANAAFEVHNSALSEVAALAFEYGYNVQEPNRLVIWEAQYGDFVNNAQTVIDEFIVSAREKWGQTPSLVMLLPHGWEGAGPDHSSGRLERFLQLAAKINMRIANCTTAAQYFHLLRRQSLLLESDPLPLVIMSPKSLLRNPHVASTLSDLTDKTWEPVIDDDTADPAQVERLVFCSGKFYYDLVTSEHRAQHPEVAIVRVEQLYPFHVEALQTVLDRYPAVKQIVWAQEEPKNMGAWEFISYRLKKLVGQNIPVNYVGRRRSSSPAEGSSTAHKANHALIVEYAFNWRFDRNEAE